MVPWGEDGGVGKRAIESELEEAVLVCVEGLGGGCGLCVLA